MTEPAIYVCRVKTPDGFKDLVTLVPPESMSEHGLAGEAIVGGLSRELKPGEQITPDLFARNRVFVEFLHDVIARRGPHEPACRAEARRLGTGWVYVIDQRTPTPGGDVPPEDIIGVFQVEGGEIVPGSYKASSEHRILSDNGFFQLSGFLQDCLLHELTDRPVPP